MSSRGEEFLPLSEVALQAVAGPHSRHTALLEDAFHVLLETPGGGVSIRGDSKGRAAAKRAVRLIAERADAGSDITEADVRVALSSASHDGPTRPGHSAMPVGRRGAVQPKTAAGGLQKHVEGVFQQRRVPAVGAGDGLQGHLGQGHELLAARAHATSAATWATCAVRLPRAVRAIRTGTMRPIRSAGPSAWTACR